MPLLPRISRFSKRISMLAFIVLFIFQTNAYAFSVYSNRELDELEKEFIQQINLSSEVERNPLANQYINHIGKILALTANMPDPHFFIVKSNEINAFAGPGGHIGVNTRLILATESESELAAVMGHELAHVRLHHLYRMMEHQKQMQVPMLASMLAALALGVVNPALANGAIMAAMGGFAQDTINFTRANEKEADRIGINMLAHGGFDPRAMATFFRKMHENMRYYYTANLPAILRTHPLDEQRIAEAENRLASFEKKLVVSSPDYYLFKEVIRNATATQPKQFQEYYQRECTHHSPSFACEYGYALTLLKLARFKEAENKLQALLMTDSNNLYYQTTVADAELGQKKYTEALERLNNLYIVHPDNYAAIMAYTNALIAIGHHEKAVGVLLKGFRLYKQDLAICEQLARAQANARQKAFAYFTESQCQLLQGRHRDAVRKLKLVSSMTKQDPYLHARASALIDEIKFKTEK